MPTIYVAQSKAVSKWGEDVGVTKHLYKIGMTEADAAAAVEALNEAAHAGATDWRLVAKAEVDALDEADLIERLTMKERMIDPSYYPRIKGARGIFKVKLANVENSLLMQAAMAGNQLTAIKLKPVDIGAYLIQNAVE